MSLALCANQEEYLLRREVAGQQGIALPPSLVWSALWLYGPVNLTAIKQSLDALINRHAVFQVTVLHNSSISPTERKERLRAFALNGQYQSGLFLQAHVADVAHKLELIDATTMDEQEFSRYLALLRKHRHSRPTNYQAPPFLEAVLIKRRQDRCLLLLFVDHLICDTWSLNIVKKDFIQIYSGYLVNGGRSSLDSSGLSFTAFAARQKQLCNSGYFKRHVEFWHEKWARFGSARVAVEDFPFYKRTESQFLFNVAQTVFSAAESRRIAAATRALRVTFYMLFLAAYVLLLRRYTGRNQIAVWSHFANRSQADTVNTIGFLANTHLLGFDLDQHSTGIALINEAKAVVSAAASYQEMPLSHLWRTLHYYPRFSDATPLIRVTTLERDSDKPICLPTGLVIENAELPLVGSIGFSTFGANVVVAEEAVSISLHYSEALFASEAVITAVEELKHLVLALVACPTVALSDLLGTFPECQPRSSPHPGNRAMDEFLLFGSALLPCVPCDKSHGEGAGMTGT